MTTMATHPNRRSCSGEEGIALVLAMFMVLVVSLLGASLATVGRTETLSSLNYKTMSQARYAAGTREILECWFEGRPIREEYLIVDAGKLAGAGAHSYSAGNATGGSDEAARFKQKA